MNAERLCYAHLQNGKILSALKISLRVSAITSGNTQPFLPQAKSGIGQN